MTVAAAWLEYHVTAQRDWALRVYADGRVDEYSDERLEFVDGDFRPVALPLEWRRLTRLTAPELGQLRDMVRQLDFFELPERLDAATDVLDGAAIAWTIELDGRRHRVSGRGPEAGRHPELEALRVTLERMTAEALQRDAAGSTDAAAVE